MLLNVWLPMLQPTIIIVLLLRFVEAMKLFDIPFALTAAGRASQRSPTRFWRSAPVFVFSTWVTPARWPTACYWS